MRKLKDLEERLRETIEEFGRRVKRDNSLRPYLNVSNYVRNAGDIEINTDNPFTMHLFLTRRLKIAYQSNNLSLLESVPSWTGYSDNNTITYSLPKSGRYHPFSNETTGEKVSLVNVVFGKISQAAGGLPRFYRYLRNLVDEFCEKRDTLRYEIMNSKLYQAVGKAVAHDESISEKDVIAVLRRTYRVEELKRLHKIIGLVEKAEEIYDLAGRLFEGLRHYKAA